MISRLLSKRLLATVVTNFRTTNISKFLDVASYSQTLCTNISPIWT